MSLTISLKSKNFKEVHSFLEMYYEKEILLDKDVSEWLYVYNKPLDIIDILSAAVDNLERFKLSIQICPENGEPLPVTFENHNDIIKTILYLYNSNEK